jgi:hypothetical protein
MGRKILPVGANTKRCPFDWDCDAPAAGQLFGATVSGNSPSAANPAVYG